MKGALIAAFFTLGPVAAGLVYGRILDRRELAAFIAFAERIPPFAYRVSVDITKMAKALQRASEATRRFAETHR